MSKIFRIDKKAIEKIKEKRAEIMNELKELEKYGDIGKILIERIDHNFDALLAVIDELERYDTFNAYAYAFKEFVDVLERLWSYYLVIERLIGRIEPFARILSLMEYYKENLWKKIADIFEAMRLIAPLLSVVIEENVYGDEDE